MIFSDQQWKWFNRRNIGANKSLLQNNGSKRLRIMHMDFGLVHWKKFRNHTEETGMCCDSVFLYFVYCGDIVLKIINCRRSWIIQRFYRPPAGFRTTSVAGFICFVVGIKILLVARFGIVCNFVWNYSCYWKVLSCFFRTKFKNHSYH